MARLVDKYRNGVYNRTVTLQLNQTDKRTVTTDQNGNVTWTIPLSPQANNTATTYNIIVSFSGDQNKTVTAYLYNPYGTQYAVSTTIQYNIGTAPGYIPSANSTSIYVTPQTTKEETTLKSPEQMQKRQRVDRCLKFKQSSACGFHWTKESITKDRFIDQVQIFQTRFMSHKV